VTTAPWRIGVIGAGWFASRRHCPDVAAHPQARLSALCRRDKAALKKMGEAFGVDALFTDYRELIAADRVDAVLICSPHDLHYEHTMAALDAGLHVLLVAQNPPYWRHAARLRQAFDEGDLGDLESAAICWAGNALGVLGRELLPDDLPGVVPPTLFRSDAVTQGGFLVDGGSHLLCELLWCTRQRVVAVTAQMDDVQADIRAVLTLQLANGAFASLVQTADSQLRRKRQHSVYYGSRGTATVTGFPFSLQLDSPSVQANWTEEELPDVPTPVQDLINAMQGHGPVRIDGDTAVHVVEILDAAYRAAAQGRRVTID